MKLKKLFWTGNTYSLLIRRHWNTFFGLAVVFEVKTPRMEKVLPADAGYHIVEVRNVVESFKEDFEALDNWVSFSSTVCDQYCEFYILSRYKDDNIFYKSQNMFSDLQAEMSKFARISRGYTPS